MRALMWFRSDLRVSDNTALTEACRAADDGVVAVFVVSSGQWRSHDWGTPKTDFVLRNVAALGDALAKLNIPLRIIRADRFADVPESLWRVFEECSCDALYFNHEHEINEIRRDEAVRAWWEKRGFVTRGCVDQTVLNVERIRTQSNKFYSVFTPFKRKWLSILKEDGLPDVRSKPPKQKIIDVRGDEASKLPVESHLASLADAWPAGESEAARRLTRFVQNGIAEYHSRRDFPSVDGTSTLSPYLAAGVVSSRQCLEAALIANNGRIDSDSKGVTTWISELVWREFYRHILVGFPRVSMSRPFRLETEGIEWNRDDTLFDAWCAGRTGYPIVDASMRQLNETGWMHNRLRMVTAMFLSKDLFLDWRHGERYFMQRLVDGDLASNNGGWQWAASTGTDAAPYFRIFNPYSQSRRFDAAGDFIRRYVPKLRELDANSIHEPPPLVAQAVGYPLPIVDRSNSRKRVLAAFKALQREV